MGIDGQVVMTDSSMEQVLNAYWEHIFLSDKCYSLEVLNSLLENQHFVDPRPPSWIPDIDAQRLMEVAQGVRASAFAGPGGWSIPQLKSLPMAAWHDYAHMLHLFERHGFPLRSGLPYFQKEATVMH